MNRQTRQQKAKAIHKAKLRAKTQTNRNANQGIIEDKPEVCLGETKRLSEGKLKIKKGYYYRGVCIKELTDEEYNVPNRQHTAVCKVIGYVFQPNTFYSRMG